MDNGHHAGSLSPDEAADLLGVSARTVRRWIARGELAGTRDPYSTTKGAVDALRRCQQGHGDLYSPPLMDKRPPPMDKRPSLMDNADSMDNAAAAVDTGEGTAVMVAIAAELAGAREQIERLARENGRLAALLEARPAPQSEAALGGPRARRRSRGPLGRLLALLW